MYTFDRAVGSGFSQPIKKAKQKCEAVIAKEIMKGELNATCGIFNLKHNYNWKDRQEVEHSGSVSTPAINVTVVKSGHELASCEDDVMTSQVNPHFEQ